MKEFINGYEKIHNLFGYFPTFHDDIIERVEITKDRVLLTIDLETKPKNSEEDFKLEIIFNEVSSINIEGDIYEIVTIIFDIDFNKKGDLIETKISSSLGVSGVIESRNVEINVV